MRHPSLFVIPAAAALAVGIIGFTAQAASAAPAAPAQKGGPAAVATGSVAPSTKLPALAPAAAPFAGYQQVTSALLADPAGQQVSGSAACPSGTRLVGGGAVISSSSLSENLNASVPLSDGLTWKVYVNNSSTTAGTFRVYADCVAQVKAYHVVVGTGVSNAAGTQTVATVSCPANTFPLGGGGFASSGSTAVNLNSSLPVTNGWRTDVNNASTGSNTATAYVVCGKKPTRYAVVSGTATTVGASSQAFATVACPTGTAVLSGGGFSSSGSTAVNINTSAPSGSGAWIAYENNGTTGATSLTAYAVCGRAVA